MSSEQPKVPPRPARSTERSADPMSDVPQIPPRPQRRPERSVSPVREGYTRSPLNDLPPFQAPSKDGKLYTQRNLSAQDLPPRPPSVNLPSIGQEGMEYASFEDAPSTSPEQHKTVSPDLPMHAPKASVPQTTATSRIQGVTRTDSSQAAAVGIGRAESEVHPLRAKSSFSRSNLSLSHEPTQEEHDHGIPEIGLQVPMLKFAGDVQAPTPTASAQGTPGIGFADASQRNHHRKRSSRQEFHGPPGSYGLHGHRLDPQDQFEKAWYAKHPEELKKEHRPYDPGHAPGDWALSSDDLNKLVRESASRGAGFATSPLVSSTPDEQIGYRASEQYTSRMNSPKPTLLSNLPKRPSSGAQPAVESPLKRQSFNLPDSDHENAMESEVEGEIIHVDPPAHRATKIGGGGYDPPTQDLGPDGGNTEEKGGWIIENGYGIPILASDEVAKNKDQSAEYMQPAVSPEMEKRGNDYYSAYESDSSNQGPSRRRSKEKLRTQSNDLTRFKSREAVQASGAGTPLEEIEEYEPLFPEDEDKKPLTAADKLKRPELARHQFPSQDIWEDAPESLQYQTTVSGPQEPDDLTSSATFEPPEKEQARKEGNDPTDRADFLTEETKRMAKSHFKPGVASEVARPELKHRFPSQDIWEDVPDSLQLQTTVDTPQEEQDIQSPDVKSPQDRPGIPARPARTKMSDVTSPTSPTKPHIPARPKPQVPARPAKADSSDDGSPLEKTISPPTKAKPAVPARPTSNKFAALKAGFLDNLNARIGLGPQAPVKHDEPAAEETPVEKAPLADARKGRAKGPARRKPATEAAAATATTSTTSNTSSFSFGTTLTIFQINDDGDLSVPTSALSSTAAKGAQEIEKIAAANTDAAAPADPTTTTSAPAEEDKIARSGLPAQAIGHTGDIPDPKISDATIDRASAIQSEFQAALRSADAPSTVGGTDVAAAVPDHSSEVPVQGGQSAISGTGAETAGSNTEHKRQPQMTDQSVQTGQQDIHIKSPSGEEEKMTLMLGGRAPEEGNVVVKEDGEEIVGGMDERHRTATIGHGM